MPWDVTVVEPVSHLDGWGGTEPALSRLADHVDGLDLEYFGPGGGVALVKPAVLDAVAVEYDIDLQPM